MNNQLDEKQLVRYNYNAMKKLVINKISEIKFIFSSQSRHVIEMYIITLSVIIWAAVRLGDPNYGRWRGGAG